MLASRLSEDPTISVLLLERGPLKDVFMSRVPLMSQNYVSSWSTGIQDRFSEPIAAYNDRRLQLASGEGLGGTSRLNGLLVTRGTPGGYNEWAGELGMEGWAWNDVEPYFARMETALDRSDTYYRGQKGEHMPGNEAFFRGKSLTLRQDLWSTERPIGDTGSIHSTCLPQSQFNNTGN